MKLSFAPLPRWKSKLEAVDQRLNDNLESPGKDFSERMFSKPIGLK